MEQVQHKISISFGGGRCTHGQPTAVLFTRNNKIFFLTNSSATKLLFVHLRPVRNHQNTTHSTGRSCIQPIFKHNLAEYQGPAPQQPPGISKMFLAGSLTLYYTLVSFLIKAANVLLVKSNVPVQCPSAKCVNFPPHKI
jgi:hypothetical protein